jgi:hypothetical protein
VPPCLLIELRHQALEPSHLLAYALLLLFEALATRARLDHCLIDFPSRGLKDRQSRSHRYLSGTSLGQLRFRFLNLGLGLPDLGR